LIPGGALAATWTVTKTADTNDGVCDADCSLREAVASAAVTSDTIVFSSLFNAPQTITLAGHSLVITKAVAVVGPGAELLTIAGTGAIDVLDVIGFGLFQVNLSGLTIAAGIHGIDNSAGDLLVSNCIITGNSSSGIVNSNFLRIYTSTISGNSGVGIDNDSGAIIDEIMDSTITGNTSAFSVGGIDNSGDLTLHNCTVSNNTATISSPGAGGIRNEGTLVIENSTISGNFKTGGTDNGGGIRNGLAASLIVYSSTITSNTADGANSASGAYGSGGFGNTIIAANVNNTTVPDVAGGFFSYGYNLIGNAGTATGFTQTGDQKGTGAALLNPMLDPLGDYGGPTQTHRLQSGSPAIDKGKALGFLSTEDQRHFSRPFDNASIPPAVGGDNSDIGAYEEQAFVLITGRVVNLSGDSILNAHLSIVGQNGEAHETFTNRSGHYRFDGARPGEKYTIVVTHPRFKFVPKVVRVTEPIRDLNFAALTR
jgi:CSLREA domain-containing protein